jgi:hypothetical protein
MSPIDQSGIRDRVRRSLGKLGKLLVLVAPGALIIFCMPVSQLVHESHGLVGFLFGITLMVTACITSRIIWIFTGCNWLDSIMGIDDL